MAKIRVSADATTEISVSLPGLPDGPAAPAYFLLLETIDFTTGRKRKVAGGSFPLFRNAATWGAAERGNQPETAGSNPSLRAD